MIIYNVTIKVEKSIHDAWLPWMKNEHIQEVVNTGCFTHAVMLHLIEADDRESITYAIQYHAESKAMYNRYIEKYSQEIRKKVIEKWGDKLIAFRTVMQVVN